MKPSTFAAIVLMAVAGVSSSRAVDEGAFAAASEAYGKGDYASAAETLSAPGKTSSGTLHNLGNAEFKLGHVGAAVLAWERALAAAPGSRNSAANLRFARAQAGLIDPQYPWHEKYSAMLSPEVWLAIATLSFWCAVSALALPALLKRRRAAWTQVAAVICIALLLFTLPAVAGLISRGRIGVIVSAETELRLTPTKEAEVLGKLAEGELARAEKVRGGYVYIRGASDRAGWVESRQFEKIWP